MFGECLSLLVIHHCYYQAPGDVVGRRSSDGDAIMESSTDGIEGEPGSPLGWGMVDWTDTASSMAHVFVSTSSSIDNCYLQSECLHSGHR